MVKAVRKAWAALGVEVKRGSVAQTMAKSVSSAFQIRLQKKSWICGKNSIAKALSQETKSVFKI